MTRVHIDGAWAAALAASLMLAAAPAWAQGKGPQGPFANVIANAQCTVDGTDVLVTAALEQKEKPGPGTYDVGWVTFFLEQKLRNDPKFQEVVGSKVSLFVNASFLEVAAGERVDVEHFLYAGACSLAIDPNANAVRAVVEIEVRNANPDRPGGLIHTGRCLSFPNPCRR